MNKYTKSQNKRGNGKFNSKIYAKGDKIFLYFQFLIFIYLFKFFFFGGGGSGLT
jgi:hypothetical protein